MRPLRGGLATRGARRATSTAALACVASHPRIDHPKIHHLSWRGSSRSRPPQWRCSRSRSRSRRLRGSRRVDRDHSGDQLTVYSNFPLQGPDARPPRRSSTARSSRSSRSAGASGATKSNTRCSTTRTPRPANGPELIATYAPPSPRRTPPRSRTSESSTRAPPPCRCRWSTPPASSRSPQGSRSCC